jgi:aminoglycoside phosphotransferase (APT) family kinase protein
MTALEIERPDGQTKRMVVRQPSDEVLRQNPRAAQDEFRLLQLMQSTGLATPAPYHLDQSGKILPTSYLVTEYVEGALEFAPADLANCVLQLATHLARIHSVDPARLDLSFLPQHAHGCAGTSG